MEDSVADKRGILIGEKLAKALKVNTGEKIVLMAQAADGSMGAEAFRVKGIFRSGNPEMDRAIAYIQIKAAQDLLVYGDKVSEVALLLDHSRNTEAVQTAIKQQTDRKFEILNWKEVSPDLVAMLNMFDLNVIIVMIIIYVLVAMGILNTLLMAIIERVPEFGVLISVGMRPSKMILMVLLEAFFLGCLGVFSGTLIGLADVAFLSRHGINFAAFSEGLGRFMGMETIIYSLFSWKGIIVPSFFVLVAAMIAAVYPSWKAARLQPVEAIRHI